jgi:hypothetical protein
MTAPDPSQNAARIAALQLLCDYKQFTLTTAETILCSGDHPAQPGFLPVTPSRVAVVWTAVYRGRLPMSKVLVVDAVLVPLATAIQLGSAEERLALIDLQLLGLGYRKSSFGGG